MIVERSHYCLARLSLEALSEHGVHSGQGDATHDVLLVRDGNDLPALPGSSLAGVLRHAYAERHGKAAADSLFGQAGASPQPSWLSVSWALVHDRNNQPCEGLQPGQGNEDQLLALLLNPKPLVRQRVRLEHSGAAAEHGKFDLTRIPAGVRYTGWLAYWCDGSEKSRQHWQQLIELLRTQALRIGHGTRSGSGHFAVHALAQASWDLRTAAGREAYASRPRSRRDSHGLVPVALSGATNGLHVCLDLQAEAGWRIGGGERSLNRPDNEADLLPQHSLRVSWPQGGPAHPEQLCHLLPGSAIKGAVRHRTAFHYRCLSGDFAHAGSADDASFDPGDCPAVIELFGQATPTRASAGLLVFHDLLLQRSDTAVLTHNRIDRFTGGVIKGALFSEEVLWHTPLRLRIDVIGGARLHKVDARARQALQLALQDLACGWLALGANGSRGLGVFSDVAGEGPQWSDGGKWVSAEAAETVEMQA